MLPRSESKIVSQPRTSGTRGDLSSALRDASETVTDADLSVSRERLAYGLPCAKCHLYYAANLDSCPGCHSKERVSAGTSRVTHPAVDSEPTSDQAALEREREEFLQQFKSQIDGGVSEYAEASAACAFSLQHPESTEPASICQPCYQRLQQRIDVLEAALHVDLKEAAQIVYQAVWADPSDPAKTYANAAAALLTELRKRAGVSSVLGPFQHRGN